MQSSSLPVITNFMSLREKKLVVVSPVITVILWGRRERLRQCQSSRDSLMFPWGILNWLNDWVRANVFGAIVGMAVPKNKEVRHWWGVEEGSASGGCKNDILNK